MPLVVSTVLTLPCHWPSHPRACPALHCRPVYKAFGEVQDGWEAALGQSLISYTRTGDMWNFDGLGKPGTSERAVGLVQSTDRTP